MHAAHTTDAAAGTTCIIVLINMNTLSESTEHVVYSIFKLRRRYAISKLHKLPKSAEHNYILAV